MTEPIQESSIPYPPKPRRSPLKLDHDKEDDADTCRWVVIQSRIDGSFELCTTLMFFKDCVVYCHRLNEGLEGLEEFSKFDIMTGEDEESTVIRDADIVYESRLERREYAILAQAELIQRKRGYQRSRTTAEAQAVHDALVNDGISQDQARVCLESV